MKKTAAAAETETVPPQPQTRRPRRSRRQPAQATTAQAAPVAVAETAPPPTPDVDTHTPPAEAAIDKKKKKLKVIRDSFTMPKSDYDRIAALKQKTLEAGISIKKSELLRAGLLALEAMPLSKLKALLGAVESVKTGRPSTK